MKPQTRAFLDKAQELVGQADTMLEVGLNEPAGRTAYLVGLHAAQALIFENTGKIVTSHKGVQSELGRLTKDDPRVAPELRAFLPQTYNLKAIADYETGPGSKISPEKASAAIQTAPRLLECILTLLPPNSPTSPAPDAP